jgi:glycine cleavage system aminomethyltransferase T/glycine/D-amino acid oxidase-like deaminating enzyme
MYARAKPFYTQWQGDAPMVARAIPEQAQVVIIGAGGIVGSFLAYHLVQRGWTNIVGIDSSSIPTNVGSTAHASDFCYSTGADKFSIYTTTYSQRFYEQMGRYLRKGGMEVARVGDDERMDELKRKVGLGKAFGTNVSMITPREAKERFPLLDEASIQGALWDPDAGLVTPRSQQAAAEIVAMAQASGNYQPIPNTTATDIEVENGRVQGVHTSRGFIKSPVVVITAGIWGPLVGQMAGIQVPLVPVEHPLLFFGPLDLLSGTGEEMVYPLFRDQSNSAYVRDTGDPATSEGGWLELGYYEQLNPRVVLSEDIRKVGEGLFSPSMNELLMEQVAEPYERACETVPILADLRWNDRHSFNGLLSFTPDGNQLLGETEVRGLWLGEAVWVKDGPGVGNVLAEWMTHGHPSRDPHAADISRFYPMQTERSYVRDRSWETAKKVYGIVHPREPFTLGRNLLHSPFYASEVELGGHFMEAAGWERAHGYAANEPLLEKYRDRIPVRENEWDSRHFWEVSNAEHLAMSDNVGMINLSHFAIFDVEGPDALALLDYLSVANVDVADGRAVYTNFLTSLGGIHSDLTITRLGADRFRVVTGGADGNRDRLWMSKWRDDKGFDAGINDRTREIATLGLWGPNARSILQTFVTDPEDVSNERFPFGSAKFMEVAGIPVWALRISYTGELGWEIYMRFEDGDHLWRSLLDAGVTPVGIETYANSRRLEKSFRLQGADLETEYNLVEAGLARPRVKRTSFLGREAYEEIRQRDSQPASLCTMTVDSSIDEKGVQRFITGNWPILDPETNVVLTDSVGRRSYNTSAAYGPSLNEQLLMGYLPSAYAREGTSLLIEYFGEHFPITVRSTSARGLYDPDNSRVKAGAVERRQPTPAGS